MTNDGDRVRRALRLASEDMPTPDGMAETTWRRGRRVRRRRAVASGAGATAVIGTTVLAWALLGPTGLTGPRDPMPAGAPTTTSTPLPTDAPGPSTASGPTSAAPTGVPTSTEPSSTVAPPTGQDTGPALVETAPEPTQEEPDVVPVDASAETERVWGVLRSSCLEDRGYEVFVTGSSLTATQRGAQSGDYTRDTALCDAELVMRLPPVKISFEEGELSATADAALRAVYEGYVATAECVRGQGLPVDEPPEGDEFVNLFAQEWMPSWHPWTAAAAQGSYAQVRSACPVSTS